jgi:hypothetical protein
MTAETKLIRGRWSVSPLREAKTLLGVLKQEGLTGKHLIAAFEKYAPILLGYNRANMDALFRKQTGRGLSDYILIQRAFAVVRCNELGPEAAVLRRALRSSRSFKKPIE